MSDVTRAAGQLTILQKVCAIRERIPHWRTATW
jgi:hypothetical protein